MWATTFGLVSMSPSCQVSILATEPLSEPTRWWPRTFLHYAVAVGNPCRVVRKRFDDEFIAYLLELKWWDWDIEKIEANFEALSSGDVSLIRKIDQ